jgi:thiosulfate dehydrogenase [quinone] large subunit
MTDAQENERIARRLTKTYALRIPDDVITSALTGRPKLPILLSRASFRADVDVRTNQRTQLRRDRRNFLRAALALGVISAATMISWNLGSSLQPASTTQLTTSANLPAVASNPVVQNGQPAANTQLIANASTIPTDQSMIYNDPSLGPIILIHLDNGQFVAYSAICTHAGCQVQFDPSLKDIVCPCHGAVYDPYHNAQVIGGPAPYPLQQVPIHYNPSTGNIYLNG